MLAVQAAEADSTSHAAAVSLAMAAEALSQPDAYAAWSIAGRLAPSDAGTITAVARAAAAHGHCAIAIELFYHLAEYGETLSVEFYVTLGWMLVEEARLADARLQMQIAIAMSPNDPGVRELELHLEQTT